MKIADNTVDLDMRTNYPWEGNIELTVDPLEAAEFSLAIRIPSWVRGEPVPGDLYQYLATKQRQYAVKVNGRPVSDRLNNGYLSIHRSWQKGDVVTIDFPMTVNRVISHPMVQENLGKVAFERGPILFCFEGIDNEGEADKIVVRDDVDINFHYQDKLMNGTYALQAKGYLEGNTKEQRLFTAIPYYQWSNRGTGKMAVWINR